MVIVSRSSSIGTTGSTTISTAGNATISATKALEKPEYWHTPFSIPVVCKQGAIYTI